VIAGVRIGLSFWIEKFSTGRQIPALPPAFATPPTSAFRHPLPGDHDRRRIGVGRGDRRHYQGVDDPKPIEPMLTHSSTAATVIQEQLVG